MSSIGFSDVGDGYHDVNRVFDCVHPSRNHAIISSQSHWREHAANPLLRRASDHHDGSQFHTIRSSVVNLKDQ